MYNFTSFVIISMPLKKLVYVHSKRMILKKISSKVVVFYFRLPSNLIVTWPEGDEVRPNEKRPAGKTIGLFSFLFTMHRFLPRGKSDSHSIVKFDLERYMNLNHV